MKKFKTFLVSSLVLVGLAACNPQNSGSVDIINSTQPSVSVIDPSTTPAPSTTPTPSTSTSTSVTEPVEWPTAALEKNYGVAIPKFEASNYKIYDELLDSYGLIYIYVASPSADACETYAAQFGEGWQVGSETDEDGVFYEAIYQTGYTGVAVTFYISEGEMVIQISNVLLTGKWPTAEIKTAIGDFAVVPEYEAGAQVYYDESYLNSYGCVTVSFDSNDSAAEYASYSATLKAAGWKVKFVADEENGDAYYAADASLQTGIMFYIDSQNYFTIDIYAYNEELFGKFNTLDESYNGSYIAYTATEAKEITIADDVVTIAGTAWNITAENSGVYTLTKDTANVYMKDVDGTLLLSDNAESFDTPSATLMKIETVEVPATLRGEFTGAMTVVIAKSSLTIDGNEARLVKVLDEKYIVYYQNSLFEASVTVEGETATLVIKNFFTKADVATLTRSGTVEIIEDSIFDFTAKPTAKVATEEELSYELDNATFKVLKSTSTTKANNYIAADKGSVRAYCGQTVSISVKQGTIDSIEIEGIENKGFAIADATVTGGTMSKTANGISISAESGAKEITIALVGSKGNFQMTKVTVKMA